MKYIIALNLCIGFLLGCGDSDLMKQIKSYRGDGDIKFIESPGPLGRPGVAINFPSIDLSENFFTSYNVTGIPKGNAYLIYLVLKEAKFSRKLSTGICSYTLTKYGNIISKQSSEIIKLMNTANSGKILYYFHTKSIGPAYFSIDDPSANWSLSVSYENKNNIDDGSVYFLIKTGGFK